jgi:hypothetical protein
MSRLTSRIKSMFCSTYASLLMGPAIGFIMGRTGYSLGLNYGMASTLGTFSQIHSNSQRNSTLTYSIRVMFYVFIILCLMLDRSVFFHGDMVAQRCCQYGRHRAAACCLPSSARYSTVYHTAHYSTNLLRCFIE